MRLGSETHKRLVSTESREVSGYRLERTINMGAGVVRCTRTVIVRELPA